MWEIKLIHVMNILLFLGVLQCVTAKSMIIDQHIAPTINDVWICKSLKLDPDTTYHLNHFRAFRSDLSVHHLGLGACEEPGSEEEYWNCDDRPGMHQSEPNLPVSTSCKDHLMVGLYGRAYGTGPLKMPRDHAYEVGKDTKYKHLILQVHYVNVSADSYHRGGQVIQYDTGPKLNTTTVMFGVYNDDKSNILPPGKQTIVEAYREMNVQVHPIISQIHAHSLARSSTVYVVKRGALGNGKDKWIRLEKRDPRLPQDYVPVENEVTADVGDGIAVRCTYFNDRDEPTHIGSTEENEMCEISITGWCKAGDEGKLDDENFNMNLRWKEDVGLNNIPSDA